MCICAYTLGAYRPLMRHQCTCMYIWVYMCTYPSRIETPVYMYMYVIYVCVSYISFICQTIIPGRTERTQQCPTKSGGPKKSDVKAHRGSPIPHAPRMHAYYTYACAYASHAHAYVSCAYAYAMLRRSCPQTLFFFFARAGTASNPPPHRSRDPAPSAALTTGSNELCKLKHALHAQTLGVRTRSIDLKICGDLKICERTLRFRRS